ncbi:transposase [Agrobacterium tumefaciens]|uniref:Transposase n=2 Tax=Agrobacterium TaxID=357 RepID=A0AAE7RE59_9HYPH|nr:IS66 family insertion sequence element accessory protein TnpB [Agrobacterium rosae]NSY04874.1 transposase [Agrobacterium tumefaciens]NSZ15146.1 transposase [Agrobacterium fabrum]NTE90009.1 transposase [Agrobacterium rubi]NTH23217.1 transposase [Rhizobium rhizogenes]UXT93224.1 transposase [Agrobacterium pusense]
MIFPSNRVRIMVATKPVDFRKGHDGLAALVKNELRKDAVIGRMRIEGALFLRQPRPFLLPDHAKTCFLDLARLTTGSRASNFLSK